MSMARLRILVVEDEAIVAESIKACLEEQGHEIPAVLASGEEAVERFAGLAPDLAVMDIRLAGRMDGIEAAAKMQATAALPVIFLTAYADRATLERAREVQPAAYLVKPFSEHELKAAIEMAAHRREIQRRLRASEIRYRDLVENLNDAIYSVDVEGVVRYLSPAIERIVGYAAAEVLGRRYLEFVHPGDREALQASFRDLLAGKLYPSEYRMVARSGEVRWVRSSSRPTYEEGRLVAFRGVLTDITERKLAETALRESEERLANALHMGRMGPWELDVASGIFTFTDSFYAIFRTSAAEMGGYRMSIEEYTRRFVHPEDAHKVGEETRRAIATDDPGYGRYIEHRMLYADGSAGHIAVRFFIVKNAAGRTVRTYGVNQDITERKRAEQSLRDAQARTASVLAGIADTFYSLDDQWRFALVNPAAERAPFGRPAAELLGKCIWDLYPKLVGTDIHRRYLDAAARKSLEHYEAQSPLNGRWYEVFMQGWTGGVDVYMRDVTGRREAEEAIRESEERYRLLFETMLNGFALHEVVLDGAGKPCDYRFLEVNLAFEEMTGLAREKIVGRTVREVIPDIEDFWIERYGGVALGGEPVRFEAETAALGRWFSIFAYSPQEGRFATVFEDITGRKQAERALTRERAQKDAILTSMADAVFTASGTGAIQTCNQRALDMLGYRGEELVGRSLGVIFAAAQDLPHRGVESLRAALGRGEIRDYDANLKRHDGSSLPVSLSCALLSRGPGEAPDIVVVARDIGSRKRLQEEQREYARRLEHEVSERTREIAEREARYRALFEDVGHAIVLTGLDGRLESWNGAADRLFGWSGGDRGRGIEEAMCRKPDCPEHAEMLARVLEAGAWSHECQAAAAGGAEVPLHLTISVIRGADGQGRGLMWVIADQSERRKLAEELRRAQDYAEIMLRETGPRGKLVGKGKVHRALVRSVKECAEAPSPVLVLGESGVGKEVVARAVHLNSPRAEKPFVVVDCAAIQGSLLERELFGHEKGAFTGATESRRGLIEVADGGTLFVDEIGEMPLELQPKLLRVLERGEFRPIGSTRERTVDIRVLAATNRDLAAGVKKKHFRADLFFRLNVLRVDIPPLRERKEDIPELARHFLENCRVTIPVKKKLGREALKHLEAYDWPGNVRELANVIERAIIVSGQDELITPKHLPLEVVLASTSAAGASAGPGKVRTLEEVEREAIAQALSAVGGNKTRAAAALGISRTTLHQKLEKYGLK